jgi:hypothetical protein
VTSFKGQHAFQAPGAAVPPESKVFVYDEGEKPLKNPLKWIELDDKWMI